MHQTGTSKHIIGKLANPEPTPPHGQRDLSKNQEKNQTGKPLTQAYLMISTELGREHEVRERLGAHPEVKGTHMVVGKYDIIAKIEAPDAESLKKVVFDNIRLIGGVRATLTMIIMDPED